jgi:hypothetical protein
MSNILGSTVRKIYDLIHNPKKPEKNRPKPDFKLQLIKSSSFQLQKPSITEKDSGSSQEPLITPKTSDSSRDDGMTEQIQNTEIFSQSKIFETKLDKI